MSASNLALQKNANPQPGLLGGRAQMLNNTADRSFGLPCSSALNRPSTFN